MLHTLLSLLLRLLLLGVGLVVAFALVVAMLTIAGVWGARAVWARLLGRPFVPFVMPIDPRAGFGRMWQSGSKHATGQPPVRTNRAVGDVTDVQPK